MRALIEILVFVRVVEAGGISAAARQLDQRASSVSRSIMRLEAHLGGRLVNRGSRALSLTELGEAVYGGCASVARKLDEVEETARRYTTQLSTKLRVSVPVVFGQECLIPLLPAFLLRHPDVAVDVDVADRFIDMPADPFDAAIRVADEPPAGLIARRLGEASKILVASARHVSDAGEPRTPRDLAGHRVLLPESALAGADLVLRRGDSVCRVPMSRRIVLNHDAAILAAVRGHVGIGLVPGYAARAGLRSGDLVHVFPQWGAGPANGRHVVNVLYPPIRPVPQKVRAFVEFLAEHRQALGLD